MLLVCLWLGPVRGWDPGGVAGQWAGPWEGRIWSSDGRRRKEGQTSAQSLPLSFLLAGWVPWCGGTPARPPGLSREQTPSPGGGFSPKS